MPTGRLVSPATGMPSFTFADGHLRADPNRGSARPARRPGRPDDGVEEQDTAGLRRTLAADALIASTYLAGTNTRRVRRALATLFGGAVGGEPGVAQGEGRLGGLERPLARRSRSCG